MGSVCSKVGAARKRLSVLVVQKWENGFTPYHGEDLPLRGVATLTPRPGQVYSFLLDDLRLVGGKERYARPVRDNRRSGGDRLAARPAR
jgi:hypothetical protein